jgi:ribonucleoside-diphosphate reductase alpha chain
LAWKLGCKGITVYRDQSKEYQVLGNTEHDVKTQNSKFKTKYLIQSKLKTKTLKERAKEGLVPVFKTHFEACPECGGAVVEQEGCVLCHNCGWSACTG